MTTKKTEPMGERLRALMERENLVDPMLRGLAQSAGEGNLKAIEYVLRLLGEAPAPPGSEPLGYRIELGPGVEELAK